MLTGKYLLTFQGIIMPSTSGPSHPRKKF